MRERTEGCPGVPPRRVIDPSVGKRRPRSILIVVDLPEPFGPRRPKTSPRSTVRSRPSTATTRGRSQKSRKTLVTPRHSTTVSVRSVPSLGVEFEFMRRFPNPLLAGEEHPGRNVLQPRDLTRVPTGFSDDETDRDRFREGHGRETVLSADCCGNEGARRGMVDRGGYR